MSLNPATNPVTRRSTQKLGRDGVVSAIAAAIAAAITGRVELTPEEAGLLLVGLNLACAWAYRMLRDRGLLAPGAGV
jgi:hypothetical protein